MSNSLATSQLTLPEYWLEYSHLSSPPTFMDNFEGMDVALEAAEAPETSRVPDIQIGGHDEMDALLKLEQL